MADQLIKVALIEGLSLYGKALAHLLSLDPQIQVVADLQRVAAAAIEATEPHVILVDIDSHVLDISETMRLCRAHRPQAKVCVLTQHLKPEIMQRALSVGVDGFLIKDILPIDFIRAIKTIAAGTTFVDARVAGGLLRRRNETIGRTEELSLRELDIVRLIADGLSNKEISSRLFLSEKTIKNHTSRIFTKFGVTARTQVAVYALKAGLV